MFEKITFPTRCRKGIFTRIAVAAMIGAGWIVATAGAGFTSPVSGC